ncbi:hypothetical protein LUZ63_000754 [Rhynchospora breviuscula]|uniref:RNase H type-1 domain-containing protein n=1 Tax=Rhynchospora breviuscula TaxID=2022672 RepID=A0A9Q0CVM5_9POAL|nr:hypothetical protein LUZ63_000754 [Rhynchospora breviuscula]
MYFDGASSIQPAVRPRLPRMRAGIGLVFVTPEGGILRHSFALTEPCTNNEAEYEALITGLETAASMGIKRLRVYGDSQLILNQVSSKYQIVKLELIKYHEKARELIAQFSQVMLEKVSRAMNGKADALAILAKELGDPDEKEIQVVVRN